MQEENGKGTLEDRVNIILDELSLGIQWERPCLILVVYRSEIIKKTVQIALDKFLGESGKIVYHYTVDKNHYDIPLELLKHPRHQQAVFSISGLRWGGGRGYSNAFRALNMHREYLVDGNIKAIFWLTINEAKQVTRFSPDFWAFRHKVVEFLDIPSTKPGLLPGSFNYSHIDHPSARHELDFQNRVDAAEKFYALGCMEDALLNFRMALHKHPEETGLNLKIAEIYLSMGRLTAAGRILRQAKKEPAKNNSMRELERLDQVAKSIQPGVGGFLEPIT